MRKEAQGRVVLSVINSTACNALSSKFSRPPLLGPKRFKLKLNVQVGPKYESEKQRCFPQLRGIKHFSFTRDVLILDGLSTFG